MNCCHDQAPCSHELPVFALDYFIEEPMVSVYIALVVVDVDNLALVHGQLSIS
jgi:hypothetical protein